MVFRNRIIFFLMLSDVFLITGSGLIDPILAIFIKDNLVGGTIFAAGLASTLFLVTKSAIQIPFSRLVDKYPDNFDMKWLAIGTFCIALVPFIYIFTTDVNIIFLTQILHGIGSGLAYPAWLGLWSTHLDKKQESFEWSFYSTLVGIGTAASAVVGGFVAEMLGFRIVFLVDGILAMTGALLLFKLKRMTKALVE